MGTAIAKAPRISKRGRVNEGRPSKLAPWMYRVAGVMGKLGATLENLAEAFEVDERTVDEWIATDAEFSRSTKEARDALDARVERSLFERAMGFEHDSEKIFCNSKGEVSRAEHKVKYAPDTAAAIFWLKNRQPKKWRDKLEITPADNPNTGQLTPQLVIDGLVSAAQRHPIAREPMIRLLTSALDRLQAIPE